jgi:hypothetical protein
MTEYQVKPKDVFVLRTGGRRGGPPRPPEPGVAGWLRRNRLRLALGVILVEGVLAVVYDIPWYLLFAIAVGLVALVIANRRRLRTPVIRNAAWILALSQGIVAFVPLFVTSVIAILIVCAVVVLIMVMVALGERAR